MDQITGNFLDIDMEEGKIALYGALRAVESFRPMADEELKLAAGTVIAADIAYMRRAGVDKGEVYDEDAAFLASRKALEKALPKRKKYLDDLADYAMEAWELYLNAAGAIDWD